LQVFIAALFITVKNWKQHKFLQLGSGYAHKIENYSVIKGLNYLYMQEHGEFHEYYAMERGCQGLEMEGGEWLWRKRHKRVWRGCEENDLYLDCEPYFLCCWNFLSLCVCVCVCVCVCLYSFSQWCWGNASLVLLFFFFLSCNFILFCLLGFVFFLTNI